MLYFQLLNFREQDVTSQKVELKVTSLFPPSDIPTPNGSSIKYQDAPELGSATNLFSLWKDEVAKLEVKLTPDISASLPPGFITWNVEGQTIPDNLTEIVLDTSSFEFHTVNVGFPLLGKSKTVIFEVPDVGDISELEAAIALFPAGHSVVLAFYADQALDYVNTGPGSSLPPPMQDAIRHSYWNALSAFDPTFPDIFIELFTTAHEYRNKYDDKQQAFNSTMDLWNNHIGRIVGNTVVSGSEIISALTNSYNEGNMIIWEGGNISQGQSEGILIKSNGDKIFPVEE